jgi:hypothetical protein
MLYGPYSRSGQTAFQQLSSVFRPNLAGLSDRQLTDAVAAELGVDAFQSPRTLKPMEFRNQTYCSNTQAGRSLRPPAGRRPVLSPVLEVGSDRTACGPCE